MASFLAAIVIDRAAGAAALACARRTGRVYSVLDVPEGVPEVGGVECVDVAVKQNHGVSFLSVVTKHAAPSDPTPGPDQAPSNGCSSIAPAGGEEIAAMALQSDRTFCAQLQARRYRP